MSRAGFGGSGDYGSFFGSLYNYQKSQSDAEQAAADQDAMSKWQNGLMSDQEWLDYIRGRVDAYAGDPKKQQTWVTYLRKYGNDISDNTAETAYKDGSTTINDLIAHYQDRLKGLSGQSDESRQLQLRINDLMDQRASDDIQTGAQKLMDQINAGKASYNDLLKFYQARRTDSRANSDLRTQLDKQIQSTRDTIRQNAVAGSFESLQYQYDSGTLSGGAYASRLRQMAVQFKTSDPQKYYQILEAAVKLEKSGGSGGGGGGGSSASRAKAAQSKQLTASIDTAQANRNNLYALIDQFDNGAKVGIDPATGQQVVFSPSKVQEIDRQLLASFDGLAKAYTAKGDGSAASQTQIAKAKYISGNLVKHNSMAAQEQENELLRTTTARINAAVDNPDPTAAMNALRDVASDWQAFSKNLVSTRTHAPVVNDAGHGLAGTAPKGILDSVDPQLSATSQTIADALATLTRPGVTEEEAASALDVAGGLGDGVKGILAPVLKVAGNQQGLATGEVARVLTQNGLQFVRTVPVSSTALVNGSMVTTTKRVPDISINDSGAQPAQQLVDVFMDVNGEPVKVSAVANLTAVQGMNAYYANSQIKLKDGTVIPKGAISQDVIAKLGKDDLAMYGNAGTISLKPAVQYYRVDVKGATDANGKPLPDTTWAQDIDTGLWYKDQLPIRGVQTYPNGVVKYDANGSPLIDYRSFSSAEGVPAPYAGGNPIKMESLFESGAAGIDTSGLKGRNVLGEVTDELNMGNPYLAPACPPGQNWWNDADRMSRSQAQLQNLRDAAMRPTPESSLQSPVDDPANATRRTADSLGINISGTRARDYFHGGQTGHQQLDVPGLRQSRAEAQADILPKGAPPTLKTFSGPQINLDGLTQARKADISDTLSRIKVKEATPKPSAAPKVKPKPLSRQQQQGITEGRATTKIDTGSQYVGKKIAL